mgnify:CR=1 FL=1
MALSQTGNTNLSMDLRSLDRLKSSGGDPRAGIKEAAKQLEGLFMQELHEDLLLFASLEPAHTTH